MQNYLPACKIVSTHGVRGEMKALPLCDGAEFLAKFKRLYATANGTGECRVLGVRFLFTSTALAALLNIRLSMNLAFNDYDGLRDDILA